MMSYSDENNSVISLTQRLVQIPSENPTGSEKECALFVEKWLTGLPGTTVEVAEVLPGRQNIIATIKGKGKKPPFIMLAHMDTVPAGEGWDVDPFAGIIKEGKLYGRGAADMKGGLAAAMVAFRNIAESDAQLEGDLILCATVDEEGPQMVGGVHFAKSGLITEDAMVVATEPSSNKLVLAHKGPTWYRIDVEGKMSHAGNAHLGVDANHALAWIILELKKAVGEMEYQHPLLGKTSLTVGVMGGGFKTNVVPQHAFAEIDIRLVPPLTCEAALGLMQKTCAAVSHAVPGAAAKVTLLSLERPPIAVAEDAPVARVFREGYFKATGASVEEVGFPAYTDAGVAFLVTGNKQCVVFGPGKIESAHTVNEYIELEELFIAEKVLTVTIKSALVQG